MQFINNISKRILGIALALAPLTSLAQDKLADLAPVDKKMRAVDSVAIMHLQQEMMENLDMPASDLYSAWDNEYYAKFNGVPSEYKVDLRNFCMPSDLPLVTSTYGYRRRFRRMHYGTDLKVYIGDTIRAAFSGKVRIVDYDRKGYGKYILIRHPNGLETLYGHLSKHLVKEDQIVKVGEPIGLGGNTGRSTGSHLHFETRFMGRFINPQLLFDFVARDVLGDFYLFRAQGEGRILSAHEAQNTPNGEFIAKTEESKNFQRERRAAIQSNRAGGTVHKVRSGESLYVIAKKYKTTVNKLCKLNGLTEKSVLRPGQILKYN